MGRGAIAFIVFGGIAGCLAPDQVEPDLSAPGTYVLIESGPDDEARALVIDSPRFVYSRSFERSALEVHRFTCPPAWYGFVAEEKMELVTTTVAADRGLLAAAWPEPADVQALEGESRHQGGVRWAFEPSLETEPLGFDPGFVPEGAPISSFSGCDGSTVFFASGEGVLVTDGGIRPLAFSEPAIAAMPVGDGTYWTLQGAPVALTRQTEVAPGTRTPTVSRGVIQAASDGPVAVSVTPTGEREESEAFLIRPGLQEPVVVGSAMGGALAPGILPTVVQRGPDAFIVGQGGLVGSHTTGVAPNRLPGVFLIAELSNRFFVLITDVNDASRRRFGGLDGGRLTIEPLPLGCAPEVGAGDPGPIRLDTFRGLLVVAWSDRLVVRSPLSPTCVVARFSAGDGAATVVVPSGLVAWGDSGPRVVDLRAATGSM